MLTMDTGIMPDQPCRYNMTVGRLPRHDLPAAGL